MIDYRLQQIYDTSIRLFISQGYSKTQVGHIVKETGISTGAVYDLFSGKKAIFEFVLRCTVDGDYINRITELPIQEVALSTLNAEVTSKLDAVVQQFEIALREKPQSCSYRDMLSQAFDLLSQYRAGCLLFEANPQVFPALFEYYKQYRLHFYTTLQEYVMLFTQQGQMRPELNANLSAKFIIETLYWWAMHVHYDGFNPSTAIPEENAKEICLDALLHAYQS